MGSCSHRPIHPVWVTKALSRLRFSSSSRTAPIVSRAPAAIPQVPIPTIILVFSPLSPSRISSFFLASSLILASSSRDFTFYHPPFPVALLLVCSKFHKAGPKNRRRNQRPPPKPPLKP